MKDYINKNLCKECGGICCQKKGCIYLPEDFESMEYEYLINKIQEGNISIVGEIFGGIEWDDSVWSYYLFLRARSAETGIVNLLNQGGRCVMHSEHGCVYEDVERPTLGVALKPVKVGGPCDKSIIKQYSYEITREWIKYQDVLKRIVFEITKKDAVELFKEQVPEDWFLYNIIKCKYIEPEIAIKKVFNRAGKDFDEHVDLKSLLLNEKQKVKKL